MRSALFPIFLSIVFSASVNACLRPQMDERAVQWSPVIVQARLVAIEPDVKLGEVVERRGPLGALGSAGTSYFERPYRFEVTESYAGTFKKGSQVSLVRLISQTQEAAVGGCAQHLAPDGVGKEFLLLLRPISQFKYIVPQGVRPPDAGAMWIIHLEPMGAIQPDTMRTLNDTIARVNAAADQATPQRIDQLISQVQDAPSDARAGPAIRALERLGPKVLPKIHEILGTTPKSFVRNRLTQVVNELTPPEPIGMIEAQKVSGGKAR